jgi:hypothetical protein
VRYSRREVTDLLRSVGGLLLASGAVALLIRKSSHHEWSDLARLLLVLAPAAWLYILALGPRRERGVVDIPPWRAVLLVTAILLVPLVLFLFLDLVGASTTDRLAEAGVFAVTAVLAGYASRRVHVPYAALLAALALLLAWLFLWTDVIGRSSANTYRWLLVAAGALLFAGAARIARSRATGAGEVATAGAVSAVAAGVIGVIAGAAAAVVAAITSTGEPSSGALHATSGASFGSTAGPAIVPLAHPQRHTLMPPHIGGLQHLGWDVYLLVVSVALVWLGSRTRVRGLGYVGGFGLLAFIVSVGVELTRLEVGRTASAAVVGWPLALLILGVAGLLAPGLRRRRA